MFEFLLPPYERTQPAGDILELLAHVDAEGLESSPGPILIARCPSNNANPQFCDAAVEWLGAAFPWFTIVIDVVSDPRRTAMQRLLAMTARGQVGVVSLHQTEMQAAVIKAAVTGLGPQQHFSHWLGAAVPLLPAEMRGRALRDFSKGYGFAPVAHDKLPRRQLLWVQAGRATRAVISIQESGGSLDLAAWQAGYHDRRAMDRSLVATFGLHARDVKGTQGWQWLLWRFVGGNGQGKRCRWDK